MKNTKILSLFLCSFFFSTSLNAHDGIGEGFNFTENKGQFKEGVSYLCKLHLGNLFLEKNKWTFDLFDPQELSSMHDKVISKRNPHGSKKENEFDQEAFNSYALKKDAYSMTFMNSNSEPIVKANKPLDGYKNYFLGENKDNWAANVKSFQSITYVGMYEGIDVEIYSQLKYLKYDFKVKRGANTSDIKISYDGVKSLKVLDNGDLEVYLSNQVVREAKLSAYQVIENKQVSVPCKFIVSRDNVVSFDFPEGYNSDYELIIDPVWVFSTLTGSTADNWGFTSTYDSQGNLYAAGISYGTGYPVTTGAYQTTFGGGQATYLDLFGDPTPNSGIFNSLVHNGFDISISKFSQNGTTLLYSTYLGGTRNESPHSLVVDSQDNLIVLASTSSNNFPTSVGAYDNTFNLGYANTQVNGYNYYWQGCDVVLSKFNPTGTNLLASTYIGGTDNEGLNEFLPFNYSDQVRGEVVVDALDNIYVATSGFSDDFPTTIGGVINNGAGYGSQDAVVFKMNSNLSALTWSTFYGGAGNDGAYSIRVSPTNNRVYICGGTVSTNLPMGSSPLIGTNTGTDLDGFIASFDGTNGAFVDATYLGTSSYDQAFILDIDLDGDIYTIGQSKGNYPIFNAAYSNANGSQFIHKLNPNLSTTIFSTKFGSGRATVDISPTAFLVDDCENVYVSGWGGSTNSEGHVGGMPLTADAQQSSTDQSDFYFMVMERNAASLLYGTYFGSPSVAEHVDGGTSRFDKKGVVYQSVCAGCGGNSFPTTPGVYSSTNGSSNCNLGAIKFEMNFLGIQAQATDPGDITLCASPYVVDFDAGANPPPYNFWDFGDGTGTSTSATPSYTYADSGSYSIMYIAIDSTTCNIRDTAYFDVTLIVPEQFNAQFNIPPIDPCDGMDSLLVSLAFTGTGADSIVWDMGNGTTFTDSLSIDYYYITQGVYTIEMTAYDLVCNNQQTFTETFNYITTFSAANAVAPPDTSFCGPPPYDLDFSATSPTPYHYWDFGDGSGTSTQVNPSYTYATPGNYDIMYVAIDSSTCNIADTAYFNVDITQAEELSASFNLPTVEPCTSPDSIEVNLAFTGTGADSLSWDMGNGDVFNDSISLDYFYTNQGTYTITMSAWDFQCNTFATFTDVVDFNLSFTTATADVPDDIFLCTSPLDVDFSAGSSPPPNSFWNFGDGLGTSTQTNPTYTFGATGDYQVMYVAIDSSTCNIADTVYFDVTLAQAETFSATLDFTPPPPCGNDSLIVDLAFTGSGADSIVWDMGNGVVFNTNSVVYAYTVPGDYTIAMTAYDNLCNNFETISETVTFAGEVVSMADVPNVFTPNGDGQNDILKIMSIDPSAEFSMTIFNRWGKKVFVSETNGDFWDGSSRLGGESHAGVYYYEVIYRDICTDEDKLKTGYVQLMRQK